MIPFLIGLLVAYSVCITLLWMATLARWYDTKEKFTLVMKELYSTDPGAFFRVYRGVGEPPKRFPNISNGRAAQDEE